jgi:hypothetical protein
MVVRWPHGQLDLVMHEVWGATSRVTSTQGVGRRFTAETCKAECRHKCENTTAVEGILLNDIKFVRTPAHVTRI